MNTKTCTKCKDTKPLTQFSKKGKGLQPKCKPCSAAYRKEYYRANRESIKQKVRDHYASNKDYHIARAIAWSAKNPDKCRASVKKWTNANKDKCKETRVAWTVKNKEHIAATTKKYSASHREQARASHRKWSANNPGNEAERTRKRDAAKKKAVPVWYDKAEVSAIYRTSAAMSVGCDKYHVDHLVPLQHPNVCGLHCADNLQIIAAEENMKKGNKFHV